MSKEYLSGHTNSVYSDGELVVKTFEDLGRSARPAELRLRSEVHALRQYSLTPTLVKVEGNKVIMSRVPGQNHLDGEVPLLPDGQKNALYEAVGQTLKFVHDFEKARPAGPEYHQQLVSSSLLKVQESAKILQRLGIDQVLLGRYIKQAYDADEVQRWGKTVVHGDYWLDNVIVRSLSGRIEPAAVIDWEMGGVGSPYIDFASVYLSIEMAHEGSSPHFWGGYGHLPKQSTKEYFAARQVIEWLAGDSEADPNSGFYKPKLALLRRLAG